MIRFAFAFRFSLLVFLALFSDISNANHPDVPDELQAEVQQLVSQAFQAARSGATASEQRRLWRKVLKLDSKNTDAMVQWGLLAMNHGPNPAIQHQGAQVLARAFDPSYCRNPIPMPSVMGMRLAMFLGRFQWEQKDFSRALYFYQLAWRASHLLPNQETAQTCVAASLATLLHPFPNSTQQADQAYTAYIRSASDFVERAHTKTPILNEPQLGTTVPGAESDPYIHCILTIFQLSFYYRANVAQAANLQYQVATSLWPQLVYSSDKIQPPAIPPHLMNAVNKRCVTRKIKLGIASGFLSPGSSVAADFGGVMQRLNREVFDVTYLHFQNHTLTPTDPFVYRHTEDTLKTYARDPTRDINNGAWMARFHEEIVALELDLLVYLDLTMSPFAHRMSMARLAPVQANSHGHPVTSGVPAVDYYISWGAAEVEYEQASKHYSETLVLLSDDVPHQYYTPRHDTQRSLMDGQPFQEIAHRSFFRKYLVSKGSLASLLFLEAKDDSSLNWYTCMQKPHKFMPEMDDLLCQVLQRDPRGIVILHQPDTPKMIGSFQRRLEAARCDMDRVYFLPVLPHHQLLALYAVSTIILDSYPAGGCTTTREALELSKVVITLPARLLGGRWTYAYYQILDDDVLNDHVIAKSPQDFVDKAVALATNEPKLLDMEQRIRGSLPNLYHRIEAVHSWEQVLLRIAPVQKLDSCDTVDGNTIS